MERTSLIVCSQPETQRRVFLYVDMPGYNADTMRSKAAQIAGRRVDYVVVLIANAAIFVPEQAPFSFSRASKIPI